MTLEDFAELLNNWGIMPLPLNTTFDELKNNEENLEAHAYYNDGIKYNLLQQSRNNNKEVSIRSYMENYDIFEVKANNFGQIFNQMYPDKPLELKDAESKTDIILYAEFSPNMSIEVHPEIKYFLPIIYTNDMLDHLILNELAGQIIMTDKYLDEDTVDLICDDPAMPPHLHGDLTKEIYRRCISRCEQAQQQGQGEEQEHGLEQGYGHPYQHQEGYEHGYPYQHQLGHEQEHWHGYPYQQGHEQEHGHGYPYQQGHELEHGHGYPYQHQQGYEQGHWHGYPYQQGHEQGHGYPYQQGYEQEHGHEHPEQHQEGHEEEHTGHQGHQRGGRGTGRQHGRDRGTHRPRGRNGGGRQ
uniref:Uncharacterized protein n=1 Tax=Meloidogyne javanica TaxID=6303 RepID=A0A915N6J3_MELJA